MQIKKIRIRVHEKHHGNGNENVTERKTMAMHVRYNSWYISLPSSAKLEREMTTFHAVVQNVDDHG